MASKSTISVRTFQKWWFKNDFSIEVDEEGNIVFLRCKVCAKNLSEITIEARRRSLKGAVLPSVQNYANGISYIHKTNIQRHVRSGGLHDWAKKNLRQVGDSTGTDENDTDSSVAAEGRQSSLVGQPRIDTTIEKGTRGCYKTYFKTALHIAKEEKPFSEFPGLINLQRQNGVKCLSGKDSDKTCREMISFLADVMRQDINNILSRANFFSGEQDGSQPCKTGTTKELVYAKVVINGGGVELLLSCQHMNDFGEDAAATKQAFDDAFLRRYQVNDGKFNKCLISVCADGASVNMGSVKGACTEMKKERPWLLIIHCANHRLELAVADAFKADKVFTKIDEMLVTVFYMFRNSGKAKRVIRQIALNLNVNFVNFVKAHGTRFQNHKYRGVRVLIINFLTLCLYAENIISGGSKERSNETAAKLRGYLKEWTSFQYLAALHLYHQVLRETAHVSYVLQDPTAIFNDIVSTLEDCKQKLSILANQTEAHDLPFDVSQSSPDSDEILITAKCTNLPATQQLKETHNLTAKQKKRMEKSISIHTDHIEIKKVQQGRRVIDGVKEQLIPSICQCIDTRFADILTKQDIYGALALADTKTWDFEDSKFGIDQINKLSDVFRQPLEFHNYSRERAVAEFKDLKRLIGSKYRYFKSKAGLWMQIFPTYSAKFPHALLLIEICLCIAWSSSTVERGFSTTGRLLSNSRLGLNKCSLDDLLLLCVNLKPLQRLDSQYEEKLVEKAVDLYIDKSHRYHNTKTKSHLPKQTTEKFQQDTFLPTPFEANNPLMEDNHLALSDSDCDVLDSDFSLEASDSSSEESMDMEASSEQLN